MPTVPDSAIGARAQGKTGSSGLVALITGFWLVLMGVRIEREPET